MLASVQVQQLTRKAPTFATKASQWLSTAKVTEPAYRTADLLRSQRFWTKGALILNAGMSNEIGVSARKNRLQTEHQVCNMLGRLSSTDNRLGLRMRLASNLGNAEAARHKAMFVRGKCPVHSAEGCVQSGVLYWDAR